MKINQISSLQHYGQQYNTHRENNTENVHFKAYIKNASNPQALAKLSIKELEILSDYVDRLKNAKFVDFKIIQHPDLVGNSWLRPVVSIKILPHADVYQFSGTKEGINGRFGVGEHKIKGTPWIDVPNYSKSGSFSHKEEITACHSKAGIGLGNSFHFKEVNGLKLDDIYTQIMDQQKYNRKIFEENYNHTLFDGMVLIDAIEEFFQKSIKTKNIAQNLLDKF